MNTENEVALELPATVQSGSGAIIQLVKREGKKYLKKSLTQNTRALVPLLKELNVRTHCYLLQDTFPWMQARKNIPTSQERIRNSEEKYIAWSHAGIPTPEKRIVNDLEYYIPFIENTVSVDAYVEATPDPAVIQKTMVALNNTREQAFKHNDVSYLHTDPNLGNFLYDKSSHVVIPIDAEFATTDKPLDTLDTLLLSQAVFYIAALQTPDTYVKEYAAIFRQAVGKQKAKEVAAQTNFSISPVAHAYLSSKKALQKVLDRNPDSFVETVQGVKHRYDTYIKDILLS